jgi:DNA-binding response OmpR family regulator
MQKTKVLYVEDEPFLARVVKESLESREYDVNLVVDGMDALDAYKAFVPDICVLDVMLPNKDGYTIAEEIRDINPGIPIIFLTAKSQTSDLLKGFNSGGNDYLKKPFSMEELIVRINNLLNLTSRQETKVPVEKENGHFRLGKFTFFPRRFELQYEDQTRKLSLRETQLLELLIQDQENPVMRKDILLKLWGDDSFYNSRNLDVYISKLRDYLSQETRIQIITLKGVGYRFIIHPGA